jgi:hypothetical protein
MTVEIVIGIVVDSFYAGNFKIWRKRKKMFFGGGSESGVIYNDIDIVI